MRLHRSQLPDLARAIIQSLLAGEDIEVDNEREAARDLEAVLGAYLDQERQAGDQARVLVQQRGLPQGEFARAKQLSADRLGIKVGDEALDYVLDQLVEMLMHSAHVEEVYSEDHTLRRRMRTHILDRAEADDKVEAEVRDKLKHVKEGSRMWEIEYERMKADIKRRRGL
ncbi:MAG: DUF507 family protein [Deltaproteobacteria bacterium]|jgi:hypothetical protein|nr:DUF507 family protein [Deltaproteobacteria bacterium]MBW2531539.1 DUF507 family protein [Deltaproteobacteria bacterium]